MANILGQTLYNNTGSWMGHQELKLPDTPKGLYLVTVTTESTVVSKKILLE
jgi:hypothetical protein